MLKCRSCDSARIVSIIPLGHLPLANALIKSDLSSTEKTYNLEVMLCEECGLAQLKDLIDPKDLFSDYVYFSSNSDAMLESSKNLTSQFIPHLNPESMVIEIASNDGYLLKNYVKHGIRVLGIDPAENIAEIANEKGIPTLCAFFGEDLGSKLSNEGKKADIIHANNVMAHVPDIKGFIKGLKTLLKEKGTAVIEVPHFLELYKHLEFDTIYHEHVYYFSAFALEKAFAQQDLEIYNIEKIPLHGGSLRLFVGNKDAHKVYPNVEQIIQEEMDVNLSDPSVYPAFMQKIQQLKQSLIKLLEKIKEQGFKIAAYGASAKGTTLLNYFGIGSQFIDFVVDRAPAKQGCYTPGTHLKILPPSALLEEEISYALLLTWNFCEEIMQQQEEFIRKGGKFIVPLPQAKVIP